MSMKGQLLKVNQGFLFFVLLTIILYYGRQILIPIVFAAMLAMLMAPLCSKLDKKGFSRAISCTICIFILFLLFLLMLGIMMAQLSGFIQDLPLFEQRANELVTSIQAYIENQFNVPVEQQTAIIQRETKNLSQSLGSYFTNTVRSSLRLLIGLIITLVFTFLMLYDKEKYHTFFLKFSTGNNRQEKEEVLNNIAQVAQRYLTGRAISIIVLFILYVITLLVIGIEGALMLAAIAAIVNIIPYVGPILAAVFPLIVALVTEESLQPAIWIIVIFSVIQGIDNYFVTPYVLGGEVSLSALSTIVFIICGGFLWGIAGMILFIPMLSIAKIIFDNVETLKPYGYLIGNPSKESPSLQIKNWFRRIFGKSGK